MDTDSNFPELDCVCGSEDNLLDDDANESDCKRGSSSSTNLVDSTFIAEDDECVNYNGAEEEDVDVDELSDPSALALRKNLFISFEKHATPVSRSESSEHRAKEVSVSGVKARIQAFENKRASSTSTSTSTSSTGITNKAQHPKSKVRFASASSANGASNGPSGTRPPTAPSITNRTEEGNRSKEQGPLLDVFLRVRPLCDKAIETEQDAVNTVEILDSKKRDLDGDKNSKATTIRTYPPIDSNTSKYVRGQHYLHSSSNNTDLIFSQKQNANTALENAAKGVKEYSFQQVFGPDSTQEEVFDNVGIPLVDGMFPNDGLKMVGDKVIGQSALLFSYGITNAGKTHTIMGKEGESKDNILEEGHGIIPRTLDRMLNKMEYLGKASTKDGSDGVKYVLYMSYLEIYNESIYDLLPKEKKTSSVSSRYPHAIALSQDGALRLGEGRNGRVNVKGLQKHHVNSLEDGLRLAKAAQAKRRTSSNNINRDSSRSHSVCQIELQACPPDIVVGNDSNSVASSASGYSTDDNSVMSNSRKKKSATIWIVDLAGSERSKRTNSFAKTVRQKEASLINSSLMKLMRCLQTLKNNQASTGSTSSVVPFRESKLTHLFMGHLSSSSASRTCMIVNINPAVSDFDETQHVLSYSTVARSIRINAEEYNRKRQVIQMKTSNIHSHGDDGRPLKKTKSPPRKIARLMKKLSPRAALVKRREQQGLLQKKKKDEQRKMAQKRKAELQSMRGTQSGPHNEKKRIKIRESKQQLEKEVKKLKTSLDEVRSFASELESQKNGLEQKLVSCEAEIRMELVEETSSQIHSMREGYNQIINKLKEEINAVPSPCKSVRKAKRDRAEELIDELMEKNDECEEEMSRMRISHEEEIDSLLEDHDKEIIELQNAFREEISKKDKEKEVLKAELGSTLQLADTLKAELEAKHFEADSDISYDADSDKENMEKIPLSSSTPKLRRLPRQRCSEVACANISPTIVEPLSSTKKQLAKGLRNALRNSNRSHPIWNPTRSPFKKHTAPDSISSKQSFKTATSETEKEDVIYPTSQPDYDNESGLYQRPRGRAPTDREWDTDRGGWKLIRCD